MQIERPQAPSPLEAKPSVQTTTYSSLTLAFTASFTSTLAWKITDIDFATHVGAKQLTLAYGIIGCFLMLSGSLIAYLRKTKSPERIFIRFQQQTWTFFLFLEFIEMQIGLSSTPVGIFSLKIIGHLYSSITLLSFWMIYDPYLVITKKSFTLLMTAAYLGVAGSGMVFNRIKFIDSSVFIPIIGILSFFVWFLANICHPKAIRRQLHFPHNLEKQEKAAPTTKFSLLTRTNFSRSSLFLIFGSILLNMLTSSIEYTVIANFESTFLPIETQGQSSSLLLGQFLTLFGLGNLLALISTTIWFSVHLSPLGLISTAIISMLFAYVGGIFFSSIDPIKHMQDSSIFMAVGSLLIVESLYPVIVQSNMMNVLSALPISTQKQARTIIESFAEAFGLGISALFIESPFAVTSTFQFVTIASSLSLLFICAFLHVRQKQILPLNNVSELSIDTTIDDNDYYTPEREKLSDEPFTIMDISNEIESVDEEYTRSTSTVHLYE